MADSVLYKDLAKKAQDLFSKDFPKERSYEITTKADNGVKFVAGLKRKDSGIEGSFNPKIEVAEKGVEVSTSINTNNEIKLEVIAKKLAPGLKTTVTGTLGKEKTLNVGFEYKHDYGTYTTAVDIYHETKAPVLALTTLVGNKGFFVGASANYSFGKVYDWTSVQSLFGYSTSKYTFTTAAHWSVDDKNKEKQGIASTLFYDIPEHSVSLGTLIDYDLLKATDRVDVSVAAAKKLDADTTVKTKFDTKGKLGLSYVQKVSKSVKLTVGGEFNTNDLSSAGGHTWGLAVALEE